MIINNIIKTIYLIYNRDTFKVNISTSKKKKKGKKVRERKICTPRVTFNLKKDFVHLSINTDLYATFPPTREDRIRSDQSCFEVLVTV